MEKQISEIIVKTYFEKLINSIDLDVAIVGAGPSGLVAGAILANNNVKVGIFERKLAPGGGMWGGAMMFNQIVVQKEATHLLDMFGISYKQYEFNLYTADSVHATSALIYNATKNGATIFNCFSIEDVILKNNKVCGIVVNWAPVHREQLHVDPLIVMAKYVIDATGHDSEVTKVLEKKNKVILNTPSGKIEGERSLSAEEAEKTTIENTKEIYPGLFITGMAANGVCGSFRMGPIFGGMLLSGEKVANLILTLIKNE
ncbi:MAG: sulfide-dependent adenosine diphosphate thiazole synthase [Bacteroidales bacterium]|nr:sulfide-dependent adenosine diphosphate thiazole synthase [Bacteroidales bacterium]